MMGAAGVIKPYWVNEKMKRPAGSIHAKHMAPIRRYSGMGMPLFESRLRSYIESDQRDVPKPMKQATTRAM